MAIKIKGEVVIDNNENLTIDGYATIGGTATIGDDVLLHGNVIDYDADQNGSIMLRIKKSMYGGNEEGYRAIVNAPPMDGWGDYNLEIGGNFNDLKLLPLDKVKIPSSVDTSMGNLEIDGNLEVGYNTDMQGTLSVDDTVDIPKMKGRGFARPFKVTKDGNQGLENAEGAYWDVTGWTEKIDGVAESSYGWMGTKFKVPEDGIYLFGFTVKTDDFNGNPDSFNMRIKNSNGDTETFYNDFNDLYSVHWQQGDDGDTESHSFHGTVMFDCNRGEQINLQYTNTNSGSGYIKSGGSTTFWGYMIAPGSGKESQVSEGGH